LWWSQPHEGNPMIETFQYQTNAHIPSITILE
jgi:hypothetical protein